MMRIDAVNRVSQLYQANSTKKVAKQTKTEKYDSVQISQMGKDYQAAKLAVAATPDVRTDLVNDIKSKLQNGTYDVSMEMLADKLLARDF
ncbi:MAG: flagellar biosynthesis anti-sigma factor FlgM [Lachnospiraceae bacterium]